MDYCQRSFQDDVKTMIHSKQDSGNDLRSFSFGSFQSSLMSSCVPSFKCGPLKKTCGTTSLLYSEEQISSQTNEEEETNSKSVDNANSISSQRSSCSDFLANYSLGKVTRGNPKKHCGSSPVVGRDIYPSSDVVITQPTSDDGSSRNENSSLDYNVLPLKFNLNHSSFVSHSEEQGSISGEHKGQVSIDKISNQSPSECHELHNEHLGCSLRGKDSTSTITKSGERELITLNNSKASVLNCSKASISSVTMKAETNYFPNESDRHKKSQNSAVNKESNVDTGGTSGFLCPENLQYPRDSTLSSLTNKKSSNEGHHANGFPIFDTTQKLFSPEDLFNEDMKPNPPESKSEIYQNFNAREADFVLRKPKRKPRKVPLPSSFMVTVSLDSDQHKACNGLIEPLATEDEVALREGTKEFMENGVLSGFESKFCHSYDMSPCEAVNFVLENSIDNFDREEYVRFKRAKDSDVKVPNIPESSYCLHSIVIKPENNKIQLGISRNSMKVINSTSNEGSSLRHFSLESNTNTVFDRSRAAKKNGNISPPGMCKIYQKSRRLTEVNDKVPESRIQKSRDYLKGYMNKEKKSKRLQFAANKSFKSVSERTSDDQSTLLGINHSFSSSDPLEEELSSYENSNSSQARFTETRKSETDNIPGVSERPRHKKSTKLYTNIKYYQITNDDQSSFENEGNKTFMDSFTSLERRGRCLSLNHTSTKRENPLFTYSNKETPKTTIDILEEVQSNLRARLASLEDLDALAETTIDGKSTPPKRRPAIPYKPLVDCTGSFTPPSSSSPCSVKDRFSSTGTTRKDKRRHGRTKKRGRRESGSHDPTRTSKALARKLSPSWSSSSSSSSSSSLSSSSSSSSDESSLSVHSKKSSSAAASSSSSSSSSSSDSSSSSIESSDIEESLI